ncbi:hypothetical protein HMPREF9120_02400 [Neisseria sp. oral taxon 020 str. F0370]|nr:hypothetical protein HMPREF9120_02400 [Neisseria sp. oral taxon 020 str. F0370]
MRPYESTVHSQKRGSVQRPPPHTMTAHPTAPPVFRRPHRTSGRLKA